jgi:hypothetical protein
MKKFICAAVIAAFAAFVPTATAQCSSHVTHSRRVVYTYSPTYQYPVHEVIVKDTIIPVAVPVLVPAFQFQYAAPCAAPVAVPGAIPAVPGHVGVSPVVPTVPGVAPMQPIAVGPGGVGAINNQEQIRLLAKALLEEMSKQADGDSGPPVALPGVGGSVPPVGGPVNPLQVLSVRCASCHTGPSSKGGVQIFTAPGQFNPTVDRQRLIRAVEDGRMPPQAVADPSFRLSPQEVSALREGLR